MAPVVDGPSGFLPKIPKELRADGDIMRGPILAGINQDDGALFVPIGIKIDRYMADNCSLVVCDVYTYII